MICPFCSLLCDANNLNEIHCDRRTASIAKYELRKRQSMEMPQSQIDSESLLTAIEASMVSALVQRFGEKCHVAVSIARDGSGISASVDGQILLETEVGRLCAPMAKQEITKALEAKEIDSQRWLQSANESLRRAKRILVTGRVSSVATARSAVAFAARFNATLDFAEFGNVFKNVLAMQRVGMNSVSLAEARDRTDQFIVIGDDTILQTVPRMPIALSSGESRGQTVLLLGDFSMASHAAWRNAGFDVWSVKCDLKSVPSALAQWSKWSDDLQSDSPNSKSLVSPLFQRMANADYTTILWCAENLRIEQADLWVERILQWIASRNEKTRCAALPWSSFDGTFLQVCTWLTGFPGRVSFRNGEPKYDPLRYSYECWLKQTQGSSDPESVVVLVDETIAANSFLTPLARKLLGNNVVIEMTGSSAQFPTSIAGLETTADMFRADQTVLARVSPCSMQKGIAKPASYWLEGLAP